MDGAFRRTASENIQPFLTMLPLPFFQAGGLFTSLTKMSSRWIQAEHMGDLRHSGLSKGLPGALAQTTLNLVTRLTIPASSAFVNASVRTCETS
jgi:hypothetical protein